MVVKLRATRSQMSNMYSSWLSIKVELIMRLFLKLPLHSCIQYEYNGDSEAYIKFCVESQLHEGEWAICSHYSVVDLKMTRIVPSSMIDAQPL